MEQETKIDALKYLSEIHRSSLERRQKIEWKAVFGVLGLNVSMILAKYQLKIDFFDNTPLVYIVFIGYGVLLSASIFFLHRLHMAHHFNRCVAEKAEDKILDMINGTPVKQINLFSDHKPWRLFRPKESGIWSFWAQIIFISLFTAMTIYLLCNGKSINQQTVSQNNYHGIIVQSSNK